VRNKLELHQGSSIPMSTSSSRAKVFAVCMHITHLVQLAYHLKFRRCNPQACTSKMNLSDEVDLEDYVGRPDKISNADIAAICQEVRHRLQHVAL
jgi:SpoVK/Ycf46/Vps4 family AAA+-type ATPase